MSVNYPSKGDYIFEGKDESFKAQYLGPSSPLQETG